MKALLAAFALSLTILVSPLADAAIFKKPLKTPVRVLWMPEPEYPEALRQANVSGKAVIQCVVDVHGKPQRVVVVTATHPEFGEAAKAAISESLFQPATEDGKPVPSRARFPILFEP